LNSIVVNEVVYTWSGLEVWLHRDQWRNATVNGQGTIELLHDNESKWWRMPFDIFAWLKVQEFGIYYFMVHHILSHYMKFGMWFNMNFQFSHSNQPTHPYFWTLKVHCKKWMNFFEKIIIIRLLIHKQVLINKFKVICFIKRHWNKMGIIKTKTISQKQAIQPCIQ
jgi:hypothetical protein